jgi:hypothetical protein
VIVPLCLLAAVLPACDLTELTGPLPLRVTPSRLSAGAETAVQIQGRGFDPCVQANYDDAEKSRVNFTFTASAGGKALVGVTWSSSTLLTATVPAGLAPGVQTLTVTGPCGEEGSLQNALTVVDGSADGGL